MMHKSAVESWAIDDNTGEHPVLLSWSENQRA